MEFYNRYNNEEDFLTREHWLNKLAGTETLIKMIRAGKNEREIKNSWSPELGKYRLLRKKYLLYPDFE